MNCPKCAGLLIQEEIQEHSGRFQGLRCIQCGLRLDQTIMQNRLAADPEESAPELDEPPAPSGASTGTTPRSGGRPRRSAGRA